MFSRRSLITAVLAGTALAGGHAFAQTNPIVGITMTTTYSADARITAVDPGARTVTVTYPSGAVATHKVSPAVADFNAHRVGDTVTASFEDKRTFVLSGPNTTVPRARDVSVTAEASAGGSAAGASADKSIANWWVTAVDPATGKISLVNPTGGQVRTYSVTTPADREQLSRIKPGDYLTAIDASTLVIAITAKA